MLGCVVAGVRSQGSAREVGLHLLLEEEDTRSPAEQQVTGEMEGEMGERNCDGRWSSTSVCWPT